MNARTSAARERILETALDLFYAHGIRATGVDTIIAESGVAKMTFYKHFPSKQLLVTEALARREGRQEQAFRAFVEPLREPRARLLAVFDFLAQGFRRKNFRGCASINAFVESADPAAPECAVARAHKQQLRRFFEATAAEAGLETVAARDLAAKLLLLCDGALVRALMEGGAQAAHTARSMAELVVDRALSA